MTACTNLVKGEFAYAFKQQDYPYRIQHIYECEFVLLEMMVGPTNSIIMEYIIIQGLLWDFMAIHCQALVFDSEVGYNEKIPHRPTESTTYELLVVHYYHKSQRSRFWNFLFSASR